MRIHDSKFDCGKKPKRKKSPTNINKFRWTRAWRTKRNDIVDRDNGLCVLCREENVYTYDGLEVHHIVPLEEDFDLRLEDDNLITLCVEHHKRADRKEISQMYLRELIRLIHGY